MNSGLSPQRDPFTSSTHLGSIAQASASTRLDFIRKTYVLFLAGILMALVAGTICLRVQPVFLAVTDLLRASPLITFLLIVGSSILAQAVSRIEGLNYAALFGFTGLMGLLFAPIIALYAPAVVSQAAFLTVIIFGAMTAYAFVSRRDFSFMGGLLFVGFIGIVLAGLGNVLWFRSAGLDYWLAWGTLFFSSGFVLYKTSNIIRYYDERDYCAAALGLFISFLNIFLSLLRILGNSRR